MIALTLGVMFGAALYLMLRRSIVKLLFGLALLSNAANLLIFLVGDIRAGRPPVVTPGARVLEPPYADPLTQALILTAIVISFGVLAFAIVLVHRTYQEVGSDDLDELTTTEED